MIARIMLVSISFSFFFFTLFFFVVPRPASAEFRTPPHGMIFWEGHGNFGGLSRQSYELIDSSEDWNRFWSRVKDQKPPVPPDFEKERGVVIYTGERQTAGFSVVFLPPRLKGSRLFVGYCIVPPKRPEAQVISRAWGMVIVPRTPRIYVVQRCSGIKNAGSGTSENDALSEAARLGKGDTLRRLLLAGIPINGLDSMGKTALIEAVIGQQIEAVRLLLRRGAKVNTPMRDGSTALFMSAYYGGREIARILLVHGANPNIQARGVAPSTLAAYFGHLNVLRVLLSHGAGLDQPDGNGYTPLFSAIRGRQSKTALALLTLGADPDRLGPNGTSPLLLAVQKGEPAVIKALLSEKDQVDLQNREGTTPLMAASRDPEVVKLLLDPRSQPQHFWQ